MNHICQASNQPKDEILRIREEYSGGYNIVLDAKYHQSTYVDLWIAVDLCRRYGLAELEEKLRNLKGIPQEPELSEPVKEPELSAFIEITDFPSPVMVRISDFRINASHIAKLTGRSRTTLANFRDRLSPKAYDILQGSSKRQGMYVDFDIGIELCREYGLAELEKRLCSLEPSSKGQVFDAEPSYTGPPSQTSRLLREPPDSNSVLSRNSSSEPTGIRDRDQHLLIARGHIFDGPIQAEDACEMDSGSDVAGSEASVISCRALSQRSTQLQAHEPIRRERDSALSRHSGTDLHYSVWDSEPRYSQLIEVKPDLKPHSWKTASPYPSFTEMY